MGALDRLTAFWRPGAGALDLSAARPALRAPVRRSGATRALVEAPLPPQAPEARHRPTRLGVQSVRSTSWARGLTPKKLSGLLRQAEDGDPTAQAELAHELQDRDTHLVSVLGTRRRAVAGLPWTVVPASDRRRDQRIAAYVEAVIRGIENWETAIVDLLDAVLVGYSGLEIDWRQSEGDVWVEELLHRPANWFIPDREFPDTWRIVSDAAPVYGEPLATGAWIWHEAKAKSGYTAATTGLVRPVVWPYLFKNYSLKDWVIFSELYGSPFRYGTYGPGSTPEDREMLYSALQALGISAAAILPEGTQIDFVEAKRNASVDAYAKLIEWCERSQSKAVLGQTLTTEEGKSGSRAHAQVHEEVRQDLLESDAGQAGRSLTRDLVRPLVRFQFGDQPRGRYPTFRFLADPPEDLQQTATLYKTLSGIGVEIPRRHVHEKFGIPEPEGGEPVYGGRLRESVPGGDIPGSAGGAGGAEGDADLRAGWSPEALQRAAVVLADELPPLPAESERLIRAALAEGGYAGWERILGALQRHLERAQRVEDLEVLLLQAVEQADLQPWAEHLGDELLRADLVGRVQVREGELPAGDWPAVPPREASAWWQGRAAVTPSQFAKLSADQQRRAFTIAQHVTLQAVQEIDQAIQDALDQGETLSEFEDRYNGALRRQGFATASPWRIQTVFRTNLGTAYAVGRHRQMRAPEVRQERPLWLYDAVDDDRTRESHAAMDGKLYPADHPVWQTWYPPNGFGCRCFVRALTPGEAAEAGYTVERALPTMRRLRPDGGLGPAEPNVPDPGFRRNPALEPHEFDFSQFPARYRRALGVEDAP